MAVTSEAGTVGEPPRMPPFRSVLKARAVEDPVNVYIERPLAYMFVRGLFRTPLTPNAVTLLAILCGVVAGVMFVWGVPEAMVAGGVLMWVSSILDGADGILARAKNLQSEFGRALDGAGDAIVAVFTVFPAFYHIWVTNHDPRQVVLMVVALALTIVHLVVYDFYKESYLRATQPGRGGDGQDADEIAETVEAAASEGPIIQMAMKYVLVPHLRRQKAIIHWLNPEAWRLRRRLRSEDQTAEIYGKANFWPMQLWALASLAPHNYLMAICAMLDRLDVYLFIRVFVINGIFLVAVIWQRRATCRTIERLAGVGAIEVSEAEQPCTT
jgi:phosphatidylglycerophosphate synthase